MPYDTESSFEADVRPRVTQAQVRQALEPLFACLPTFVMLDAQSQVEPKQAWFDGVEVGVSVTGTVGWDFKQAFDAAADNIAALSEDAFETMHISDATMQDRETCRVVGPTPQAVQAYKRRMELDTMEAALRVPPTDGITADQAAQAGQAAAVVPIPGTISAHLVGTLNLRGLNLTEPQKRRVTRHFDAMVGLVKEFTGAPEVAVVARSYASPGVCLFDEDIARMHLPRGAWELVDTVRQSGGDEFRFRNGEEERVVSVSAGRVVEVSTPAATRERGQRGG